MLIVEAARRSGTLITARMAGEQGREVFAVPGHPLDPRAEGTNGLLKTGATLVTEPDDILSALAPMLREAPRPAMPSPRLPVDGRRAATGRIAAAARCRMPTAKSCWRRWDLRRSTSTSSGRATGLSPRAIQIALLELSLAGRVERHGHQLVSLKA